MESPSWIDKLASILLEEGHCSSLEEFDAIVQCEGGESLQSNAVPLILLDYFGVSDDDSRRILKMCDPDHERITEESESHADVEDDKGFPQNDVELTEGECELCERRILLTRHHLVPRCTWPRIEPRLLHAAEAMEHGDTHRAAMIAGDGLFHLLQEGSDKASIKLALQRTCLCCRPCHSAIHRSYTNMKLALEINTVEQLLLDEKIRKFAKWANKQRPGQYARR